MFAVLYQRANEKAHAFGKGMPARAGIHPLLWQVSHADDMSGRELVRGSALQAVLFGANFVMKQAIFFTVLILLLSPPAVCHAEAKVVPSSPQQIALSFAPVVKRVAPAVVNIYTKTVVRQRVLPSFMDDPFFQQFFGGNGQGMTRERMQSALGSGVIVGADGLIVTSNHVIDGADQITVVLADRREFEARLVTADERSDLAVLRIDPKGEALPYLELKDSDEVEVGDLVLAVGDPFGVGQTVTNGIVSALARTSVEINGLNYFIQTDAAINPGNSGGALVTLDGRLIGINAAIYSQSGGSLGIGFAVPSNMVRTVINAVATGHKNIVRSWIGVEGQEITADVAASLNLARPTGMLVNGLHPASPAKAAGLKIGDVITGFNGKPIEEPGAFKYRLATISIGSVVTIDALRAGRKLTLSVTLIAPPEDPPREESRISGNNPLSGATIVNLSPAVSEELSLSDNEAGVILTKIAPRTPAASVGFRVGDKLLSVNGVKILSVGDALDVLDKRVRAWRITVQRNGNAISIMVGG